MLANAEQALQKLRHKRTGVVLPAKNIAHNTKLIYLHDEAVGLQFHRTIIATYLRDGVLIDTRDRGLDTGWFTKTTWERIDEWTPARTCQERGLRYIATSPGDGYSDREYQLYTHGTFVRPDGSADVPLHPLTSEAIAEVHRTWPRKIKRYAERSVKLWREWGMAPECCSESVHGERWIAHLEQHIRDNAYAVFPDFERHFAEPLRHQGFEDDALAKSVSENFARFLRRSVIPAIIDRIDPDFPYPQNTRN